MYDFIKGVKTIDEHTIEFDTYISIKRSIPKRFKKVKDGNYTYGVFTDKSIRYYVNGVFLPMVYCVDNVSIPISFDDKNYKQEIFRLRITFA